MKNLKLLKNTIFCFLMIAVSACSTKQPEKEHPQTPASFNANTLNINDSNHTKKVRGQVLYLPVYSNIPYFEHGKEFDLSAFVAIHNTDFANSIRITKVLLFDNDGKLVENYLANDSIVHALGATNFFVPERDKNGTGANFIIEWASDSLVNEPLIESVIVGLTNGQGVSFLSNGKILRELK